MVTVLPGYYKIRYLRPPWGKIFANEGAYIADCSRVMGFTLNDPSNMTEAGVQHVLDHYKRRQDTNEAQPLKLNMTAPDHATRGKRPKKVRYVDSDDEEEEELVIFPFCAGFPRWSVPRKRPPS